TRITFKRPIETPSSSSNWTVKAASSRLPPFPVPLETMAKLLVLHGPNLNLLGTREPEVYGRTTLADIDADLAQRATAAGHELESFQSMPSMRWWTGSRPHARTARPSSWSTP